MEPFRAARQVALQLWANHGNNIEITLKGGEVFATLAPDCKMPPDCETSCDVIHRRNHDGSITVLKNRDSAIHPLLRNHAFAVTGRAVDPDERLFLVDLLHVGALTPTDRAPTYLDRSHTRPTTHVLAG